MELSYILKDIGNIIVTHGVIEQNYLPIERIYREHHYREHALDPRDVSHIRGFDLSYELANNVDINQNPSLLLALIEAIENNTRDDSSNIAYSFESVNQIWSDIGGSTAIEANIFANVLFNSTNILAGDGSVRYFEPLFEYLDQDGKGISQEQAEQFVQQFNPDAYIHKLSFSQYAINYYANEIKNKIRNQEPEFIANYLDDDGYFKTEEVAELFPNSGLTEDELAGVIFNVVTDRFRGNEDFDSSTIFHGQEITQMCGAEIDINVNDGISGESFSCPSISNVEIPQPDNSEEIGRAVTIAMEIFEEFRSHQLSKQFAPEENDTNITDHINYYNDFRVWAQIEHGNADMLPEHIFNQAMTVYFGEELRDMLEAEKDPSREAERHPMMRELLVNGRSLLLEPHEIRETIFPEAYLSQEQANAIMTYFVTGSNDNTLFPEIDEELQDICSVGMELRSQIHTTYETETPILYHNIIGASCPAALRGR